MKGTWLKGIVKFCMVAAVVGATGIWAGCEDSDGGGGGGGGGDFVGVWGLAGGSSGEGSIVWYAHFKSDGSYFISNKADGSGVRVTGTYDVSGADLVGPFVNPGVGEGRVECTITDGLMRMDFIEYWHQPNKVVPYSGRKI